MTILKWISPINFFLRQQDVSQIRHENTGDWFINDPDFQHWKSTPGEILWCSGIRKLQCWGILLILIGL